MARPRGRELREAKRAVRGLLEATADDVARLPAPALREMVPVLHEAMQEVERDLMAWLRNVPDGEARYTAHEYRRTLIQLRRARFEVGARLSKFPRWVLRIREKMLGVLWKRGRAAGVLGTEHLQTQIAVLSRIFNDPVGGAIDLQSAAHLARGEQMLIPRYEASAARYSGAVWRDMKRQLAIGVSRRESIFQLTKRLQRLGGPASGSMGEGLFRRYRHWAERVVRTEMIHAYNLQQSEALRELHADDPGIRQRWDSSLDSRLCPICYDLHGQVVGIGEDFPGGHPHPPAHPNCRCALVAWRADWGVPALTKEKLTPEIHQEAQEP